MRRLLVPILLVLLVLGGSASASAAFRIPAGSEAVALQDGVGKARLALRGAVVGNFTRGVVVITRPAKGAVTVDVDGAERVRQLNGRTTLYRGTDVRFYVTGRTVVAVRGSGIDVSAVGRGRLTLRGTGGKYSIAGGKSRNWPRSARTFRVGS